MSAFKDLTNQRFYRLTPICPTKKRTNGHVVWLLRCDCGNLTEVRGSDLLNGNTKSCGCLQKERAMGVIKHGDTPKGKTPRIYDTWRNIKKRCLNPNDTNYKYYGGRGITIFDEWKNSYVSFRDWALANGYDDDLTIDRINNDGNYTPLNCHWITQSENSSKPKHKYKEIK